MKKISPLFFTLVTLFFVSCGGKSAVRPALMNLDDTTSACRFMDEVCHEADEFQREWSAMEEEQKNELTTVLNSYIEHCSKAAKECRKSIK